MLRVFAPLRVRAYWGRLCSTESSIESEGTCSEHSRALVSMPMATFVGVARIYERSVSQVRSVHGVARYVGRARGWCGRPEQCVGAGTEGCGLHARSSAARISVQSVRMTSETSASCKSWPHPFHSLGRTARTVAWTAVGQATADMDMVLGAQIHAEWLKTSNIYPRMRSATKHVHPCTESLASPLHAPCSAHPPFRTTRELDSRKRAKMRTGPRDSVRMVQIKNLFRTPSKSSRSRPRTPTKTNG